MSKEELPEKTPIDTMKLGEMLHNPEWVKITYPHEHIKTWGMEKWIHNDANYCMKLLVVYQDM